MMHERLPKPEKPKARFLALVVCVDGTSYRVSDHGSRLDGETLDPGQTLVEVLAIVADRIRKEKP
ncbi:hypothetical protein [Ensifer sp. SSB1]|jgi:hypothetical protein|uniref:hypothetical protein n=1 Tax=Ensifer sp. SSB1 TaxID=2795385 RepID=UPI001A5F8DA9|nr:hypothetical protein [Ensifer sp. SSB1]MBK5567230.1 hypothetical protein [Ensifer sp. SSB1]